jgi:hypothetical protein
MGNAVTIGFGLLASGFACALFMPVASAQARRLDRLVAEAVARQPSKKRKDIVEEHGFEDSGPVQFLTRQLAVLAPLATGLLASATGLR